MSKHNDLTKKKGRRYFHIYQKPEGVTKVIEHLYVKAKSESKVTSECYKL